MTAVFAQWIRAVALNLGAFSIFCFLNGVCDVAGEALNCSLSPAATSNPAKFTVPNNECQRIISSSGSQKLSVQQTFKGNLGQECDLHDVERLQTWFSSLSTTSSSSVSWMLTWAMPNNSCNLTQRLTKLASYGAAHTTSSNWKMLVIYDCISSVQSPGCEKLEIPPDYQQFYVLQLTIASENQYLNQIKNFYSKNEASGYINCVCSSKDGAAEPSEDVLSSFSKTSVLFVSVSFIILMVISLAWLVFYYVQRFRYAHAKDRLARRLFNAARKALTKIPAKTLRQGDKELDADCPVCIEPYRSSDVIRILPCKHVFHKLCVDPWLLEHRTCPMCKMDILKAFGFNYTRSEESVHHLDGDQLSTGPSTEGRSSYPLPMVTDSDLQDPFFPSPAPSPSRLQPVIHSNNATSFSIIPLTVHGPLSRNADPAPGGSDSSDSTENLPRASSTSADVHREAPLILRRQSTGSRASSARSISLKREGVKTAVSYPSFTVSKVERGRSCNNAGSVESV